MLETLQFVKGAVAKKDYIPALTHFRIAGGRILGYNGRIALCSPIALDIDATPRAVELVKAISTCRQEVALHMTPNGRLAIKSGSFKAFIECTPEPFPEVKPTGQMVAVRPDFLDALRTLQDFISEDASRRWSMGVLFRGHSAYATNNIILVEYWLGYDFPHEMVIPSATIRELLRIGEAPTHMQVDGQAVTFHYTGERWLHSVLYDTTWPDVLRVLNKPSNASAPPEGLFVALQDIKPFVDEQNRVFMQPGHLGTSPKPGEGADVEVAELKDYGCYNIDQFLLLETIVKKIDLSNYPYSTFFFGDNIRGAIVGIRA